MNKRPAESQAIVFTPQAMVDTKLFQNQGIWESVKERRYTVLNTKSWMLEIKPHPSVDGVKESWKQHTLNICFRLRAKIERKK